MLRPEVSLRRCRGLDLEPRLEELARQGWESLDEATLTIHLKWLGICFRPVTPGPFMVRLRLPNSRPPPIPGGRTPVESDQP